SARALTRAVGIEAEDVAALDGGADRLPRAHRGAVALEDRAVRVAGLGLAVAVHLFRHLLERGVVRALEAHEHVRDAGFAAQREEAPRAPAARRVLLRVARRLDVEDQADREAPALAPDLRDA